MNSGTTRDFYKTLKDIRDGLEFVECVATVEKRFATEIKQIEGCPRGPRGLAGYVDCSNEYEYWRRDLDMCAKDILRGSEDSYVCVPVMSFCGLYDFLKKKADEQR